MITTTDASGVITETVADVTPFVIWFGILLAVNMQTSFMHPPFGFALFYLRSVAPRESYVDKVTGRRMAPVTTSDIYWGAIPFLVIQLIMVGLLMVVPSLVMSKPEPLLPHPAASSSPQSHQAPSSGAAIDRGFSLDPSPPHMDGAREAPLNGPGAPTLDMRELPSLSAPQRSLPGVP